MPNNYIAQPIRVHEVRALQHFRQGECGFYENPYVRSGTNLFLPNIIIQRLTSGAGFGASLHQAVLGLGPGEEGPNMGSISDPGFAIIQIDDPANQLEQAVFDRGDWVIPDVPDGYYYIKFQSGFFAWWSDEIYITAAGSVAGYPPACNGVDYVKLRFRQPLCITSGVTELLDEGGLVISRADVIAYPPGMDFFCFLLAGALVESEWEPDITEGPEDGNGDAANERHKARKRWNLQGGAVSEAIIDSMQASAFFDIIEIYFPRLTDPMFVATDVVVEANSDNRGCTYSYNYKFALKNAGYLLKQGCC